MRGKFFKPGAALNLPVYLDAEVQASPTAPGLPRPRAASAGRFHNGSIRWEAIAQLPEARQRFGSEMLQTVLAQAASR